MKNGKTATAMTDILEYFEDSLIQHGKENDRVYLMKIGKRDIDKTLDYIESLVQNNGYTKIFAKVPVCIAGNFLKRGYIQEAFIPNLYKGREGGCFLARFVNKNRGIVEEKEEIESIIAVSKGKMKTLPNREPVEGFVIEELKTDDAEEMAVLYEKVFKSYPFPIFKPEYLVKTMQENIIYFGIREKGRLVALSSSEIDYENLNAEMTDFATLESHRGKGLSLLLLQKMEDKMRQLGIKTAYTIARSLSYGMNITFARGGYEFGNTLINNTNIFGRIESMNVWHKGL